MKKIVEYTCLYCKTVFHFNDEKLRTKCPCCKVDPALAVSIPEQCKTDLHGVDQCL